MENIHFHLTNFYGVTDLFNVPDEEADLLQSFCSDRCERVVIFNRRSGDNRRVMYPVIEDALPALLKENFTLLRGFLQRAYPSNTPNDWVVLESSGNCGEQQPHQDY